VTVTLDAYVLLNSAQPGHRCFQQSKPSSTILPADWLKQFVIELTHAEIEAVLISLLLALGMVRSETAAQLKGEEP
jgi:hypothetical protein